MLNQRKESKYHQRDQEVGRIGKFYQMNMTSNPSWSNVILQWEIRIKLNLIRISIMAIVFKNQ